MVDLTLGDSVAARSAWTRFLALAPSRYASQIAEVRQQFAELHSTP
ncbi:MAG TPA: hypothetical protein VNH46_01380 [Gemmatimonadales bacterium]|nr:hypothetical protein [Gemmatimonadales bacterium]